MRNYIGVNNKNMLSPHLTASLEYWFFKVNSRPVALLVDWINRRQTHEQWLLVSIHGPNRDEALCDKHASLMPGERNFLMAYLYLHQPGKQKLVMAPFGLARVKGSPENFEIQIHRLGAETITLIGVGRDYANLGDGIINTLVGDLQIWEHENLIARAEGTAGIERRVPSK